MADANSTTTALRIARPTIAVAGQDSGALASGLLELCIVETTEGLYRCEAKFGNWGPSGNGTGFLYFDRQLLEFGKQFQVKLGSDVIFDGRILALEARFPESSPPEMTVLAEDRFQDLRMTRRTQTFFDSSDASVAQQIASDHGLTPSIDLQGPTHKVLAQVNLSDLAFLRERCRALDAELWMDGSTLYVKGRTGRGTQSIALGHGKELREFTALADLATQRSSVTVGGWDVSGKQAISENADDAAVQGELEGGDSGASVLKSALGPRKEALVHAAPANSQEAKARAESFFRAGARRFVQGRGVAEPNANLRVGAKVALSKLGPLFDGKYYVTEVKHLFDGGKGLRTEFVAERPGLGKP